MKRITITDWSKAVAVWLAVAVSLGFYYTFTYFGRSGWPMPIPEVLGACLVYCFSAMNVSPEVQAVHWVAVFPVSAVVWVGILTLTAPYFGGRPGQFSHTLLRFALAALPFLIPLPVAIYLAGKQPSGFVAGRVVAVALRHGWVTPPAWLSPVYGAMGIAALLLQLWMYRKAFGIRLGSAWIHYTLSLVLFLLGLIGLGQVFAYGQRHWLF